MAEVALVAEWRRSFRHFRHSATYHFYISREVSAVFSFHLSVFRFTKECLNTSFDTSKKNNNIKTHPANPMTRRVKIFRFYTNSSDMPWITIRIVSASMNLSYSRLLIENLMFLEIHPSSLGVFTKHVPCP